MLQLRPLRTLGVLALLLAADAGAAEGVLATINGKPITQADYTAFVRDQGLSEQAAADRDRVLQELIGQELVYQEALRQKLDQDPEVMAELASLRRKVLLNAAVTAELKRHPISDDEVRKEYNDQVKRFAQKEYQASHILLKSEEEAKKMITALDGGADFAELAKKHSVGPTGPKGGDLGWFAPQQMVPAFSQAVAKLGKGQYTKQPIQTQFGWHVIRLRDVRDMTPPPYEQVKERIEAIMQQQRVMRYVEQLKAKATIE